MKRGFGSSSGITQNGVIFTILGILIVAFLIQTYFFFSLKQNLRALHQEKQPVYSQVAKSFPKKAAHQRRYDPASSLWSSPFSGSDDPFLELDRMQSRMNQMFTDTMRRFMSSPMHQDADLAGRFFEPDVDISEQDGYYVLAIDLPGMEKEKIDVRVRDNMLIVSGERRQNQEVTEEGYYRMERSFGSFQRAFPLPPDVDVSDVQAQYEQGVLTIKVRKLDSNQEENREPKTVQVI